jgi:hypothetical protein
MVRDGARWSSIGAWVDSKHPRDEKGRFSSVAEGVKEQIAKNPEGFSWHPRAGGHDDPDGHPKDGIMVAIHPNFDKGVVIDMSKTASAEEREKQINEWVDRAWKDVNNDPNVYLGGWVDKETHQFYGDVSRRYEERQEKLAVKMGLLNNQKSIYHVGRKEVINTYGTGTKTKENVPRWVSGEMTSRELDVDEGYGGH